MAKYIFRTTATMKPYNNKNWWIDGDITDPEQIPDDIIQEHYSGVSFVDDDFFCNMEG